ncbi:MAG: ribonuclease Y [Bacteriovoracaceae bacterium]|jgi:ribonucrease Y|nr:ribonuclease Y [Bacteriovoracaceae bacterium]
MDTNTMLISVLVALAGVGIGFFVRHLMVMKEVRARQGKGDEIIDKAKKDASDIKYKARKEAKEIVKEEKDVFEKEAEKRLNVIRGQEKGIITIETKLEAKIEEQERLIKKTEVKEDDLKQAQLSVEAEIERFKRKQNEVADRLGEVSNMSREDAKKELLGIMAEEAKVDFARELKKLEEENLANAENNAKKVIGTAIQRFAGEFVADRTIGTVELPSDDVKGRLIGREGRNIRAFEQICGVDLIIDDTPEVVVVSSFNVVRRQVARRTIEMLIADGRIHPAKIEEFHDKCKAELEKEILDFGEKAQMEIGVHGIHPEILKLVGALNFRTSYTQNQYQHALEAAFICGTMAAELGLNVKQARRAGLLHDIGKVIDASAEGSHAVIGADFAKKFGEAPDIVHAIRAHHDDEKPESVLAHLVAASDALSGARPGARKAMMESYVSRLTDIEEIVNSFDGVTKSYAISGGREVRVFVENSRIDDDQTVMLSRDIAKKIEEEMSYPGTIKITVVRETKAVGVAR